MTVAAGPPTLSCDANAPPPSELPWPETAQCEGLDTWPQAWAQLELDAIARIDATRADGADCGEQGKLGRAPALVRRPELDCAARAHALDMAERDYFGRLDPDGVDERARVDAAGYAPVTLTQHIAAGPRDAAELVDQTWLPRPVPCASLVSEANTEIGLGHVGDVVDEAGHASPRWVVLLAGPGDDG